MTLNSILRRTSTLSHIVSLTECAQYTIKMGTLDINAIRDYLFQVGCKIEYPILVNAFKKHLYNPDPDVQGKVRTQFKDYVNRLATVSLENNMKFIILRPEFTPSVNEQPIDPLRRKWVIEACRCNHNGLLALLRKDPKLASYKDIVNGYTALHWAAKFGNLDIIKLIAGNHGVSTNIKSSAGHTPLHVAYIFDRIDAANLLVNSYKANVDIRDHSGKRPRQYCRQQT